MADFTLQPGRWAWLILPFLTLGCSYSNKPALQSHPIVAATPRVNDIYQHRSPEVVRYDRYTLAGTRPVDAQRDPLSQMIDITMPAQIVRSVGDGFRYLLLASGYSLCPVSSPVFSELLSRSLPAVQRTLGPIRLSEALQVLAGPAWRLRVDEVNREICFALRDEYRTFTPAVSSTPTAKMLSPAPTDPATPAAKSQDSAPPAKKAESLPVPAPTLTLPTSPASKAATLPSPASPQPKASTPIKSPSTSTPASVVTPAVPAIANVDMHAFSPGKPLKIVPSGQSWHAEVGATLKESLTRWAGQASCASGGNWVVIWPVAIDYRIDAPLTFHGNFESMLVQLFDLYHYAEKPLFAEASRLQCLVSVSDKPGGR